MIQSVNPAPTDETDGLPMPRRIWAVISNRIRSLICQYWTLTLLTSVLPHPFALISGLPRRDYLDYQQFTSWQSLFLYCLFPLWGRLSVIESISFGDWVILYHFT